MLNVVKVTEENAFWKNIKPQRSKLIGEVYFCYSRRMLVIMSGFSSFTVFSSHHKKKKKAADFLNKPAPVLALNKRKDF